MAWLSGWPKRKKLTIDHTQVDAALTDFPVYVHINGDSDIGASARSDGHDVRFTQSDGTTLLKYEREYWNISAGSCTAHVWVKLPSVSASADTEFYLYYGKADAADGEDAANVWDSSYVGVWHLREDGGTYYDSTSNDLDFASIAQDPDRTTGKIGYGQNFDGSQFTYLGDANDAHISGDAMTIEAWIKSSVSAAFHTVCAKQETANSDRNWWFGYDSNGRLGFGFSSGGTSRFDVGGGTPLDDGAWHHTAVTFNKPSIIYYVDGSSDDTSSLNYSPDANDGQDLTIGVTDAEGMYWNGDLDEVRVSSTARSAAWLAASHSNQNSPTTFYAWGSEESTGAAGRSRRIASPLGGLIGIPFQG